MKRHLSAKNLIGFSIAFTLLLSCQTTDQSGLQTAEEDGFTYQYAEEDPMGTRIYQLDNGLKVYLSDYENEPRTHIFIPVKAGGKNDPSDNTGLAHYLEHMMFKGTGQFGTINYEEEKIMLDSIEQMFNYYATLTDTDERKAYYAKIDAYSNKAAEYAIPNEYDKMISMLGGKRLNAYTSKDRTVYTVDIPSNELPRFLALEGARFRQIVNRLFHTELEAVYEEKNRALDSDIRKVYETTLKGSFSVHPYGTQLNIGTIEHLKNPSITAIKEYFNTYYRPNNVAICISGDIDYTETIKMIDQYFGTWEPNENLPKWEPPVEEPITEVKEYEVLGPDAEFLWMSYRFDGTGSEDYYKVLLIDMLLANSEAGLIDINLKQRQKVLNASSFALEMNDYMLHVLTGNAKQGQSLEEVRDLLLEQVEMIKKGDFEDWLIDAVITDFKKSAMRALESNQSRANQMVMAFTNDIPWNEYIRQIEKMEEITREEIIQFAQEKYGENYVIVYKKTGEDPNKKKVEKPQITKVPLNRESVSEFQKTLAATEVEKVQPVFVDYANDINQFEVNGIKVLTKENTENELFEMFYVLDFGRNADKKLSFAVQYLEFLGTPEYSAEEFRKELYKLGCSFSVNASTERTYVTLSGLDENMEAATTLFESLLANAVADQDALDNMIDRSLKARSDAKKNKSTILWSGLYTYGKYGEENPFNDVLKNYELQQLDGQELVEIVKGITQIPHRILYYGPRSAEEMASFLNEYHPVPDQLEPMPETKDYTEKSTEKPMVYWADYDMVQAEIVFLSKGAGYDADLTPSVRLFNEYFGGGMNSIVFQEIREAQGLAYAVFSNYQQPSKVDKSDYIFAYVGTQADKQSEAMNAMMDLLNNLPESPEAFNIAKGAILNKIESERITRSGVLWNYVSAQDKGLDYDVRKDVYEQVKGMEFEDLKSFHDQYIKGSDYITVLVGSKEKLNFEELSKYGEVRELKLDELFGYSDSESVSIQ
jgi:predicted Zn-dependent peptidase